MTLITLKISIMYQHSKKLRERSLNQMYKDNLSFLPEARIPHNDDDGADVALVVVCELPCKELLKIALFARLSLKRVAFFSKRKRKSPEVTYVSQLY